MATRKLSRGKSAGKAPPTRKGKAAARTKRPVRTKRPKRTTRTERAVRSKRAPRPAAALEASVRREQRALVAETQRTLREAGFGGRSSRSKAPGAKRKAARPARRQLH